MDQLNQDKKENISNPTLEVDIRTMEGDVKALKESGGETMGLKGERQNISRESEIQSNNELTKFAVSESGFAFPKRQESGQQEAKPFEPAPSNIESVKVAVPGEKKSALKTILIILGILILAAGFGFLGYYLSPMIFK